MMLVIRRQHTVMCHSPMYSMHSIHLLCALASFTNWAPAFLAFFEGKAPAAQILHAMACTTHAQCIVSHFNAAPNMHEVCEQSLVLLGGLGSAHRQELARLQQKGMCRHLVAPLPNDITELAAARHVSSPRSAVAE